MTVYPAKTQISLGIFSESSLCAQWVAKDPSFLHADSEDYDQTDWLGRKAHKQTLEFVSTDSRREKRGEYGTIFT